MNKWENWMIFGGSMPTIDLPYVSLPDEYEHIKQSRREDDLGNWTDDNGIKHIYVWDESNWVEWSIVNGKMVKVYDQEECPF